MSTETAIKKKIDVAATSSRVRDFYALLKPKVMSLVVFTGFAGMWIAPGFENLHPLLAVTAMLCLAIGAGAAGAVNMWYERDIDAVMNRTRGRPLPMGRIHPDEAIGFAVILSAMSVMIMGLALNWMAAALLAAGNLFYVFIYTVWLKRKTPQNIVIGGAAGAFPPMIGWAAVTGDITVFSVLMFAIIFMWTPPHFWALSLFANEDYKRANIPMLSVTHGAKSTKIHMLIYSILLLPLAAAPWFLGYAGSFYGVNALALSAFFIFTSVKVMLDDGLKSAKLMFGYSIFYLFAIFMALMIDAA